MAVKFKGWQGVINGDMSGNITGPGHDVSDVAILAVECAFTGTPTGTLKLQYSNSSTTGTDGNWDDVPAAVSTFTGQPAGAPGNKGVLTGFYPAKWVRLVYTRTSGTGTLQAYFFGKDS